MPVESTYEAFELPQIDIWTFLFERKEKPFSDDKVIYKDAATGRTYTYAQVKNTAIDFGKGLRALWDWQKGDVLALFSPNCIDTPSITWGALWAGGIISPANPAYTVDELVYQLNDAGAKGIVTQRPYLDVALKAAEKVGMDPSYVILMGDERDPNGRTKHFSSIRNISGTQRYRRVKFTNPDEDLAFLVYSSGTTGHPKGVMLSHSNIVANIHQLQAGESGNLRSTGGPDGQGDKILAFLPFFHIYGLTCLIHQSIHRGFQLVVMAKFELESFCRIIQDEKVTFVYLVPPVLLSLAKSPVVDKYDLSSVRMCNSGAAPLTRELVDLVHKRIGWPTKQGYGLSETSPTTHTQPWDDWNRTIGSVGRLLPNIKAKYLGPDDQEVAVGQVGELAMKGPNIFKGYLNKPDLTADCFTSDGYFRTGDIGYQDEEGNFFITDRVKELIKYKGFQVAPAEIEGYLVGHPSVADAAVVGVYSDEHASELPRAYLVLKQGVRRERGVAEEIVRWLHKKVAGHKKLRGGVSFVDEIPKSVSGKILRRILKERAKDELAASKADKTVKAKL